jgi:hypothetical protein
MTQNSVDTERLLQEWHRAKKNLDRAYKEHGDAIDLLFEVQQRLAVHLLPGDAEDGERLAIWVNVEQLGAFAEKEKLLEIAVNKTGTLGHAIRWREKKK